MGSAIREPCAWGAAVRETWESKPPTRDTMEPGEWLNDNSPISGGIHIVYMCKSAYVFPTNGPLP